MGRGLYLLFENDVAIFMIQLKIALKEKFYFVYTLLLPIFMVFLNKNLNFQDDGSLYIYWSYIVVTTVFNGFLINIIRLRESGFFKTLIFLVESKNMILLSNIFVQLIIVQLEILLFNIFVTLFITHLSLITFLYGFLTSFLATLLSAAMMVVLLFVKMKQDSFNFLIGSLFVLGIVLLGLHPNGILEYLLTILNPFQMIYELYIVHCSSSTLKFLIGGCTILYLAIAGFLLPKISINRYLK